MAPQAVVCYVSGAFPALRIKRGSFLDAADYTMVDAQGGKGMMAPAQIRIAAPLRRAGTVVAKAESLTTSPPIVQVKIYTL